MTADIGELPQSTGTRRLDLAVVVNGLKLVERVRDEASVDVLEKWIKSGSKISYDIILQKWSR